jgi:hypothetical protein
MAGNRDRATQSSDALSDSELRAFQTQLSTLAETACDYPLEYSLGEYEMLFESRDDIEIIVANLSESIDQSRDAA